MDQVQRILDLYIQSWNASDALQRSSLIEQLYTEDAVYIDPLAEVRGHADIDATIAAVQAMFPNHTFSLSGVGDAHHDIARFQWQLMAPDSKEPVAIGFDVVVLSEGRIRQVLGFLDKAPRLA